MSNKVGAFDAGVAFGTPGKGHDDIQSTSFMLDHDSVDLSLDMLDLADFGLRYTSAGKGGGGTKLGDQASGVARNDSLFADEDESVILDLLANDTGDGNRVTGVRAGDGSNSRLRGRASRSTWSSAARISVR